jgi:hypothetical protein
MISAAHAETNPHLYEFFKNKIEQVQTAAAQAQSENSSNFFVLEDINLDLIASVSFGVPGVLNLTVSPEIDFIFVPTDHSSEE